MPRLVVFFGGGGFFRDGDFDDGLGDGDFFGDNDDRFGDTALGDNTPLSLCFFQSVAAALNLFRALSCVPFG